MPPIVARIPVSTFMYERNGQVRKASLVIACINRCPIKQRESAGELLAGERDVIEHVHVVQWHHNSYY